jgi:hypothetical protein
MIHVAGARLVSVWGGRTGRADRFPKTGGGVTSLMGGRYEKKRKRPVRKRKGYGRVGLKSSCVTPFPGGANVLCFIFNNIPPDHRT